MLFAAVTARFDPTRRLMESPSPFRPELVKLGLRTSNNKGEVRK